jgi:hypothetical protein
MTTIKTCQCGSTPAFTEREKYGIRIMRLECACGRHGATLLYKKLEDRDRMRQAAIDGWNLA